MDTERIEVALAALQHKLDGQAEQARFYERYYDGDHPLPAGPQKAHEAYWRLLRMSRSNWMALVVDAVTERLKVDGFRFGDVEGADGDAWRMWQRNELDADSGLVHDTATTTGSAFVIVWADGSDASTPEITVEHPAEVAVVYEPGSKKRRAAALKEWRDDDGFWMATLYAPDGIYKFVSHSKSDAGPPQPKRWERREVPGEPWPLHNPLGVVPVVEFYNNPKMRSGGRSELMGITDIQDRINETLFNRLLAAQFAAFRQKWVTGMEIPVDPLTGAPVEPFKVAVDRVLMAEDSDVRFGEFSESNLQGYINSVESDIQHLAAITRTPPHYLLGSSGSFPSGDSLKATETGLVAKVRRRQVSHGESWEAVVRLGMAVLSDPRASDESGEVIWHDPESRSQGELVDALVKMGTLGVPNEVLWQRWGASPQEVERWQQMRASADLFGPQAGPQVTVDSPVTVNVPPRSASTKTIQRDRAGNMVGIIEGP